jgi:predicted enzyme related to lactoylglutathione lyase
MQTNAVCHMRSAVQKALAAIVLVLAVASGCVAPPRLDTSAMSFAAEPLLGKIVWNDLITEDLDAARRFYGGLFGWTFQETTRPGGGAYALAKQDGVYVAGLVPIGRRADGIRQSRWLPYVSVADVDQAVGRAMQSGGTVAVGARNVSVGRVAAIIDPEGAVIGLARSRIGDPDDRTTAARAGRVVWTELLANAPETTAGFYGTVFGYDTRTIERRHGAYTLLAVRGIDRAGILRNPTDRWSPVWLTHFGVADPAAAAARVESLGGKVRVAVSPELREGTMAVVEDPSGAILVLQKLST